MVPSSALFNTFPTVEAIGENLSGHFCNFNFQDGFNILKPNVSMYIFRNVLHTFCMVMITRRIF